MPIYRYEALAGDGKRIRGKLDADSESAARRQIRETRGYVVLVELDERATPARAVSGGGATSGWGARLARLFEPKPRSEDIVAMTRQLSTLLKAGIPLDEALSGMTQGHVALRPVISHVRERLREGGTLASALEGFPSIFDPTFVALVQAGEAAGTLDEVMDRLAESRARSEQVARKLRSAMAYPVLMLVVGFGILGFLLAFVVPKVTQLFINAKQALPAPTQILLSITHVFNEWWFLFVAVPVLLWMGFRYGLKRPGFRARWHRVQLRFPVMGEMVRAAVTGRFAHTLAMLLRNGVPLLRALGIARGVADNANMEAAADRAMSAAESGGDLASSFKTSPMFSPSDIQIMAAGERSGQLESMLLILAHDNEERALTRMQMLTALMEPLMILFLGIMVGFVVLAIILPIFEMSTLVH